MKFILLIIVVVVIGLGGCEPEKRDRIIFISSLAVEDKSLLIVRIAQGSPFTLIDPKRRSTNTGEVRIRIGEKFIMTDGHHISYFYTFRGVRNGRVILKELMHANLRSFGDKDKTVRKVISVRPYESTKQEVVEQGVGKAGPSPHEEELTR